MDENLRQELDGRLREIATLEPGSQERKQLFEEYKTLYAQYLEKENQSLEERKQEFEEDKKELQLKEAKKNRIVEIGKSILNGLTAVGGWLFYLSMADRFMKFDKSGELPDPMLKDLFRKSK
jgi:hypothetical protein